MYVGLTRTTTSACLGPAHGIPLVLICPTNESVDNGLHAKHPLRETYDGDCAKNLP